MRKQKWIIMIQRESVSVELVSFSCISFNVLRDDKHLAGFVCKSFLRWLHVNWNSTKNTHTFEQKKKQELSNYKNKKITLSLFVCL